MVTATTYICKVEMLAFTDCDYCQTFVNLLACLLIVLGLGTGHPENFTRNLRHVSEQDFLISYTYCEYKHVHTMRIPV